MQRDGRQCHAQQDPEEAVSKLWPVLELSVGTSATGELALAAMPLFPAVALRNVDLTRNELGYDLFQWLYLMRHKITDSRFEGSHDIPRIGSVSTQCTNLQSVDVLPVVARWLTSGYACQMQNVQNAFAEHETDLAMDHRVAARKALHRSQFVERGAVKQHDRDATARRECLTEDEDMGLVWQ
ncbi:hypothetical protein SPRG_11087 [Saprolegnia parasitica CBS 223.65]|uniref:Uncharacterized protein n=1 Tax=Saprolegnia parasitica (strain CBS 223.65) TaxID=695850 RepID=A0A067BYP3_SAPPC|nr:hypothetical protein SPRG_11087 [Saprolegnia parasitica CBS 223.65]KDO23639.1 hypothetical protein SPRG_11087 [Saprolegnia parasitica CBS 223.65]|eukprot:XP_012205622.1 hypothetical protein SPRG_11087 [Saprolegnia parasitica CBS 223.65]